MVRLPELLLRNHREVQQVRGQISRITLHFQYSLASRVETHCVSHSVLSEQILSNYLPYMPAPNMEVMNNESLGFSRLLFWGAAISVLVRLVPIS
jgi:hypothetical protein